MQPINLTIHHQQHQRIEFTTDDLEAWVSNQGGADIYQPNQHWQIACWGDPANRNEDESIIETVLNGCEKSVWGRSWLAINTSTQTVQGATDHLGLFPIFCYQDEQKTFFTSQRRGLLSADLALELNPASMRTLTAFGQLFANESIFKHTRQFSGRSLFHWQRDHGLQLHTEQRPLLGDWQSNFDSALEAFVESVRSCLNNQPQAMVSLSGGLDSRLILAAAHALGKKVTGLSYGQPNSSDIRIARALAETANIPLFTVRDKPTSMDWEFVQRVAHLGGGEVALHHAHAIQNPALLEQTAEFTLLTGTGAETSRAFYYDRGMPGYSLFGQPWFSKQLLPKAKRYIEQEFLKTAQPFFDFAPKWQDSLLDQLHQCIEQHAQAFQTPALFLDNFYLQQRVPRMVGAGQQLLDQHYLRSHPFLQKDALFHMAHLPVRYKLASSFHRQAIEKLSPKLARIEWDKTQQPLDQGLSLPRRYPALAARLNLNYWGKASGAMFDYNGLLNSLPTTALTQTLNAMQCETGKLSVSALKQAEVHQNLRSYCSVWSTLLEQMKPHQPQSV